MQKLGIDLIKEIKKTKMKQLEVEMEKVILANKEGALFVCPYCNYSSRKNRRGSAKVFDNQFFKCFSCGIWRKING